MSTEFDTLHIKKNKFSFLGNNRITIHLLLFIATFITTTIAGTQWTGHNPFEIANWQYGLTYAILIMTFITSHEMGHYIASRIHGIDATLPYFIPAPFPEMLFGTMGAVIKTHSPFPSKKALFDVGVAGPIAGFIVSVGILITGFATLPGKEYIYTIHPEYLINGGVVPETGLTFGSTIIYSFLADIFKNPNGWLPPMNEMYHYPFLCVGWFGLFVTTLNMLPIGQLDGGHVIYAMFGEKMHKRIARISWYAIFFIGIGSLLAILLDFFKSVNFPNHFYMTMQDFFIPALTRLRDAVPWFFEGWGGWLFWALITRFFIKLHHPPIMDNEKLDTKRMVIGWIAIIILMLSFSYTGIYFVQPAS